MQATGRIPAAGLRALLESSLDYAGLFPPASLPLDQAIKNYARYQLGPDAWFLSRFVCPADRLVQLDNFVGLFAKSAPLAVSVLASPNATWRELIPKVKESLALAFRFQQVHGPRVRVDSIEVALPADLTQSAGQVEVRESIRAVAEAVELSGLARVTPFFEVTAPDGEFQALNAIRSTARHNADWSGERCDRGAFKLRTGGLKAEAFPTVEQVASVIMTCLASGVRFKCTAGLHHPVRHFDPSLATKMHGFLNIFGAAALSHARLLDTSGLLAMLKDEEGTHFQFGERGFRWNDVHASVKQLTEARCAFVASFGSCSFDEPLEDLRELGML